MIQKILEANPDAQFLKAEGFDKAILGYEQETERLIYSVAKCIKILRKEGMSECEAREFFSFNVEGGYVGPKTPIWCQDDFT